MSDPYAIVCSKPRAVLQRLRDVVVAQALPAHFNNWPGLIRVVPVNVNCKESMCVLIFHRHLNTNNSKSWSEKSSGNSIL